MCFIFHPFYYFQEHAVLNKEHQTVTYNRLNQKAELSLIHINGVQNRSMFEHIKTLEISHALHMLFKAGALFSQSPTSTQYYESCIP